MERKPCRLITTALMVCAVLISGCRTIPDRQWSTAIEPKALGTPANSELMTIEIKQSGNFHDQRQFDELKRWLDTRSPTDPIVIFIHGWHHNAAPKDTNRVDFTGFVGELEAEVCQKRRALKMPCPSLDAIYVGWIGDSVDYPIGSDILDFWTIWGRKKVSRQVGRGGLANIISHIRHAHPDRQVIVAGHSLGASALFYAVRDSLGQVAEDNYEYIMMNPAVGSGEFAEVENSLNAAASRRAQAISVEQQALILARIHRKVIVLQALGDLPVGFLYRLAFLSDQPIGFDNKRVTHTAYACAKSSSRCGPGSNPDAATIGSAVSYCKLYLAQGEFVLETKSTGAQDETCRVNFSKAVWVVSGEDSVSKSHNDIFNGVQARALADLISQRLAVPAP